MIVRAIWKKIVEVYFDVFDVFCSNVSESVSESDLKNVKMDPRIYFPKIFPKKPCYSWLIVCIQLKFQKKLRIRPD